MKPLDHMNRIIAWFSLHMSQKYTIGQEEHGGRLWRKNVCKMLRDEIIDLSVYYEVLEQQYDQAVAELDTAKKIIEEFRQDEFTDEDYEVATKTEEIYKSVYNAHNILVYGNKQGELEEDH